MKSCLKFSKHVETGFLVWWDPNESFCYVLGNHTAAVYSENTITSGKSAGGSIIILEKLFISRDGETGQGWGQNESSQIQSNPRRNLFLGRKFTIQHDNNPKHTSIALHEWFKICSNGQVGRKTLIQLRICDELENCCSKSLSDRSNFTKKNGHKYQDPAVQSWSRHPKRQL